MPNRTDPIELVGWEITRRCNLSCPHCYTAAGAADRASPELSTAECLSLIDQFAARGTTTIGWTGGEPLLREDLEELSAHAKEHGIVSGVTTNGLLLDERRAARLREAGVSSLQISLDGSTAARNAVMRGATGEQFERVVDAVRIAGRHEFPRLSLSMVLGAETLDDAPAFLELASSLGVSTICFRGYVPVGRGKRREVIRRLGLSEPDRARLSALVLDCYQRELPVYFDPPFGPLPPSWEFHECRAGVDMLYLAATGVVYPCTSAISPLFAVGNLRERSLDEIWSDPRMTELSRRSLETVEGRCRTCESFEVCHGACRAVAYAHTGDLDASFPACMRGP